jgi:hypothetical protein
MLECISQEKSVQLRMDTLSEFNVILVTAVVKKELNSCAQKLNGYFTYYLFYSTTVVSAQGAFLLHNPILSGDGQYRGKRDIFHHIRR